MTVQTTEADVTNRVRVLLVDGGDQFGGQEVHVLQLAEELPESGLEVVLVCCDETLAAGARAKGIPTYTDKFSSPTDFGTSRRIADIIRKEGISLVHTHGTRAGVIGRIAAKMTGRSCVHTSHIMVTDIVLGSGIRWVLKRRLYAAMETRLARFSDMTICVSEGLKKKHLALGIPESRLTVIYNSAILPEDISEQARTSARTALGIDASRAVVGTVARLCEGKGIETLIKAAADIIKQKPDTLFLMAGDGPLSEKFETMAAGMGLSENFRFLGFRKDIHNVYLAMDVFALPSLGEGHPLCVLEAMAFGRPVVATRVSGNVEAVVENLTGLLVPAEDPDALGRAVNRILDSPDLSREMGRNGRLVVERDFSRDRMFESTREVYREVLRRREIKNSSATKNT